MVQLLCRPRATAEGLRLRRSLADPCSGRLSRRCAESPVVPWHQVKFGKLLRAEHFGRRLPSSEMGAAGASRTYP